jgi:probable phosphoglycerate mutase
MDEIWVIRHGETPWTVEGRHTGRTDLALTPGGVEEARALGRRLAAHRARPFAKVFTSPLRRAHETCRLAGFGDVAVPDPDLMEWDYGAVEGRTRYEVQARRPGWTLWDDGVEGGETVEAVGARADAVIARAMAVDGDVALFAHGHLLRILVARWLDLPARAGRRFALDTSAYGVLAESPDGRMLMRWNIR